MILSGNFLKVFNKCRPIALSNKKAQQHQTPRSVSSFCCLLHNKMKITNNNINNVLVVEPSYPLLNSFRRSPLIGQFRKCSTKDSSKTVGTECNNDLTELEYEKLSNKTLDHLSEVFEDIFDSGDFSDKEYDITYSNGVLTVNLGPKLGTYVINKQTPNKQIWLSSPVSGPKRYDYVNGTWIYKYDGISLNELLHQEFSKILKNDFKQFFFDLNDN